MKLLIRYIKKTGQNTAVEQTIVEGSRLKIGRGNDQNVLLPDSRVALGHAKLAFTDDDIKVSTAVGKYVLFNDQMVKKCSIALGSSFDIVGHVITILDGAEGCDFVIEVNINNEKPISIKERYQTRLQDLNIGKRRWSWLLFIIVIVSCLIVPVIGVLNPPVMETLRESSLPDDGHWMAGKLMKSHQFMGDDCSQCHVEPFVQVNNQQCQSCHNETKHHVDVEGIAISFEAFEQCTDCHKEHNDENTLEHYSQEVCVDCHQDDEQTGLKGKGRGIVTDFEEQHPSFNATMLIPTKKSDKNTLLMANVKKLTGAQSPLLQQPFSNINDQWIKQKVLLADNKVKEHSNLKFPHKLHMDPEGINSATDKVTMQCANCHEPEKGGLQMKPVTMEKHCQSCHTLTFDANDPERVVPHGSPTDVVMMMREYYAFRYIYQQLNIDDKNVIQTAGDLFSIREARRPGKSKKLRKSFEDSMNAQTISSIEKLTKNTVRTDALLWAESRASNAAFDLFERQACTVCHVVTKLENENGEAASDIPWHVEPVVLTKTWLPAARFAHSEHESTQCIDCHQADNSELSSDILIPDVDNCRQCHGGEHSEKKIQNTCIDCHDFHQATMQYFMVDKNIDINKAHNGNGHIERDHTKDKLNRGEH